MAYESGLANDIDSLLSAIRSACVTHGWTLSGDVLHKGDAYIHSTVSGTGIRWRGGTGIDGTDALTGPGPQYVRNDNFAQEITYPVTWEAHIHTDPDEVYIVLNYSVDFYQYAAWGISTVDVPGTGMWYGASRYAASGGTVNDFLINPGNSDRTSTDSTRGAPLFFIKSAGNSCQTSFVHHGLDGGGWSALNGTLVPWSFYAINPLLALLPNQWNDQTELLPYPVFMPRSSGNKVSMLADLAHLRHCRIDFHDPGDVLTLGEDQWKLYPWYRKNTTSRDGGVAVSHSGTLGFAVRYSG